MTLIIENANVETLRVIESLKGLNKKLKVIKSPNKGTLKAISEGEKSCKISKKANESLITSGARQKGHCWMYKLASYSELF